MGAFVRFLGQINLLLTIGLVIGFIFTDFNASKKERGKKSIWSETKGSGGPKLHQLLVWFTHTILQHAEAGKD